MPARILNHNPFARPLGCNGLYGKSGRIRHTKAGEPVCLKCRESSGHYQRELRSRGIPKRKLKPCGTNAAARRHRRKGEALCFKCKLAEAESRASYYRKEKC